MRKQIIRIWVSYAQHVFLSASYNTLFAQASFTFNASQYFHLLEPIFGVFSFVFAKCGFVSML